jgi:cell division protein FtsN
VGKHIDAYPEMIARGIPDMIWGKLGFGKGKKQEDVALHGEGEDPGGVEEGEFDLTFYDTLSKKRAGSTGAARRRKPGTEQAKAPAVSSRTVPEATDVHSPPGERPSREMNGKKLPPPVPGDAGPSRGSAETAGKEYVVHVASFREKEKADQLAKKIAAFGHHAAVQMREVPGRGTWFRVVMSDFKTREEAQKALDAVGARIRGFKATILAVDGKKD